MTHRLVTRSDFDGLVCAVLLRELELIDDIAFVHPKDVQDGVVEITGRDILTNLPYAPGAAMVFDHHHSEDLRGTGREANHVILADAPSAARVVYDHFGGAERFPDVPEELLAAVDQADSAAYTRDDGALVVSSFVARLPEDKSHPVEPILIGNALLRPLQAMTYIADLLVVRPASRGDEREAPRFEVQARGNDQGQMNKDR